MRPKLDLIGSKENCKSSSGKSPLDQEKRFASVLFAIQQKSKIIVSDHPAGNFKQTGPSFTGSGKISIFGGSVKFSAAVFSF